MAYIFLCLGFGFIAVTSFIIARVKVGGIKALSIKVFAAIFYIVLTLSIMAENGLTHLALFIVAGQVFGLLGDVFLDQKYIHPNQGESYTHLGFFVFGLGHIIYIIGMLVFYNFTATMILVTIGITMAITGFVVMTEKPFGLDYGVMKRDILLYSIIIGFATALPFSWILLNGLSTIQVNLFFIAMIAFLVSDLILSQIYFGQDKNKPALIIPNYIFYFAAQYLIGLSLLWI